ncbi:MAG: cell division protein FtsQ/DivIB, partial [Gammaproteobacteria bacterium]|nr:cell division protein FtsQ/DivIB [Gammaproteobacteria bacterium]
MSHKRHLFLISAVIVLLMLAWQWNEFDFNTVSPIKKVEIEGELENISRDIFREKVIAVIDGGYFSLDLDLMRSNLMTMPWVDDVSVRRQWPSSLYIRVTEKQPVAYWNDDAMISDRGDVFKPEVIAQQHDLPRLSGPDGLHKKMWRFLVAINKDFSSMGFEVLNLSLDDRRAWSFNFSSEKIIDEIEVKLGRDHAEERLARFVRVFSNRDKFDLKNTAVIDLRYP